MLKLLARDFFRSDAQFVVVEPRSPQPLFPLHEHDFCEIVIVASGSGWHVLNDEPHLLSCGEVFYLRTGDRHAFDEVNDLYLIGVSPSRYREQARPRVIDPSGPASWPERSAGPRRDAS